MKTPTITAIGLALALAACGNPPAQTIHGKDGSKMRVEQSGANEGQAVFEDGKGGKATMTGASATWPASAPAAAPAYPGASITSTMDGAVDGSKSLVVTFETADAPDKVIAFYKSKTEAAGFKAASSMTFEAVQMFSAQVGDGKKIVSVQTSTEAGKTTAMVSYVEKSS